MTMTNNTTTFAGHFMNAAASLMDGMADPMKHTFKVARNQAIDALRASSGELEDEVAASLVTMIRDVAREHGYRI